jgi:hypothetical protein
MLRKIATWVLVLCLTIWCGLALNICIAIISSGFNGVVPKVLHLFGRKNQLGLVSGDLVVWRLLGLLVITIGAAYFYWHKPRLTNRRVDHP